MRSGPATFLICANVLPLVGCGGTSTTSEVDPEVQHAVYVFWKDLKNATMTSDGPNAQAAYARLHAEAQTQQTLDEFNSYWREWVQRRSVGWVHPDRLDRLQLEPVEVSEDSATIQVAIDFSGPPGDVFGDATETVTFRQKLKKHDDQWFVYSTEDPTGTSEPAGGDVTSP